MKYDEVRSLSQFLRSQVPGLLVEHDGATARPRRAELSRGCQACKAGAWICIYVGVKCNLSCEFCPQISRHRKEEHIWANGGDDDIHALADLERCMARNPRIHGISFSGGEPLLYLDVVLEWSRFVRARWPQIYQWVYTNGHRITRRQLEKLAAVGIDEIRVDLASTDYAPRVVRKLEACRALFGKVGVEVPVVPWQTERLLEVLPRLEALGVDYLNLHELVIQPDNLVRLTRNGRLDRDLVYPSRADKLFYLPSLLDVYRVIRRIEHLGLKLVYNDCGARHYALQNLGWAYQRSRQRPGAEREAWEDYYSRTSCGW